MMAQRLAVVCGGDADAACDRAVRVGAGGYGVDVEPARAKGMLAKLDEAFTRAGKKRGPDYQVIVTPPMTAGPETVTEYAALGVHRLVVMLGSQRPEKIDQRLPELEQWVKAAG